MGLRLMLFRRISPVQTVDQPEDRRFYGRRKGKRLRAGQQSLLETLYPRLAIDPISRGEAEEGPRPDLAGSVDPKALFEGHMETPPQALWLEIGFGGGEHLAHQALQNPTIGLIGAEPFLNGISKLLSKVDEHDIKNVRLYGEDVRPFLDRLPEACFEKIFLLFPDPWPKARHWRRRFMNAWNLDLLGRLLVDGGELRVASDDPTYQTWTMRVGPVHPLFQWTAQTAADWNTRWPDACPTRYEQKAIRCGRTPMYFSFRRVPRSAVE
jgi:tRNA (guanine-N7-)-methyltransferase